MKTILLVEDNAGIVELMCDVLTEEGYSLVIAYTCREAFAQLEIMDPDLIICDLMLTDGSSEGLGRYARSHPRLRQVPILLISAIRPTDIPAATWYTNYLAKPFDLTDLLERIECLTAIA